MATRDPAVFPSLQDVKPSTKPLVKGMALPKKAKITLDAMEMSDPGQLRPGSMETERILNVLDETAAKLEMSSLIPCVIDSLDRFTDALGPEVTENLLELQELSMAMQCLLASSGEESSTRAEEQRSRLCFLEQRLKGSVRNVLRLLLASPWLPQALKATAGLAGSAAEGLVRAFGEFRGFMLQRLLTGAVEEEGKTQCVADISLQMKQHTEAIAALQTKLAAAVQARDDEVSRKDNLIKDLQTRIQDLAKDSKVSSQRIKEEAEEQQEGELQASQSRCAGLQQDMEQLQRQLIALVLEHRASERALRKRKRRLEMEIWNWVQQYDTDMAQKQAEYEEVDAAYAEERAQLSLLTEKHALLLQEYTQIEEERRMLQEREEEALKELNTKNRAAARIQALWKGYLVRRLYRPKKKGKGKKGKK